MNGSDTQTVECPERRAVVVLCDAHPSFVSIAIRPARKGVIRRRERTCVAIAGGIRGIRYSLYMLLFKPLVS